MEKHVSGIPPDKEVTPQVVPLCERHWDCCDEEGCPGLYYYFPNTENIVYQGKCC